MIVDVAMFSLMGLAVAYLVRRMGDAAPMALVACAAALLTVVGLSILLAAIGGRPLEGSSETAVVRFVGSLAGAVVGVLLGSRHRALITSGGDLPIWVGDKSIGPVLAGVFVIGITILELYRAGLWAESSAGGNTEVARKFMIPLGAVQTSNAPAVASLQGSAEKKSQGDETQVKQAADTFGKAPTASEARAAVDRQPPSKEASHGAPASMQAEGPAQKNDSGATPSESKHSNGKTAATNSPWTNSTSAAEPQASDASTRPAPPTKVAAVSDASRAQLPPSTVQISESASTSSVPQRAAATQSAARMAMQTCNSWYAFAEKVRACVALPCENCRGQNEARRALGDRNAAAFSRGLHDCYTAHADTALVDRCTRADAERAMGYATLFLADPHAPVPKSP